MLRAKEIQTFYNRHGKKYANFNNTTKKRGKGRMGRTKRHKSKGEKKNSRSPIMAYSSPPTIPTSSTTSILRPIPSFCQ